jgi:hypothetical protein
MDATELKLAIHQPLLVLQLLPWKIESPTLQQRNRCSTYASHLYGCICKNLNATGTVGMLFM